MAYTVETTDQPLNCFRNQIIIEEACFQLKRSVVLFRSKSRHLISFADKGSSLKIRKEVVNHDVVKAIDCNLPTLASFQHDLNAHFPAPQFRNCKRTLVVKTNS